MTEKYEIFGDDADEINKLSDPDKDGKLGLSIRNKWKRGRLKELIKPLPQKEEKLLSEILRRAPWVILYYGPEALEKLDGKLRQLDLRIPFLGLIFKGAIEGLKFLRNYLMIK